MTDVGFKDTDWAYTVEGLNSSQKAVLVALCHRTDDKTHKTFIGQQTVVEMTNLSESTVSRSMKELDTMKVIDREKRYGKLGYRTSDLVTVDTTYTSERLPGTVPTRQDAYQEQGPDLTVTVTPPTSHGEGAMITQRSTRGSSSRGTRLDPDWMPGNDLIAVLRAECPNVDQQREHRKFVDYWISQPGQKGVRLNWDATWRNWVRRAAENASRGYRANPDEKAQRSRDTGRALAALAASEQKGISA